MAKKCDVYAAKKTLSERVGFFLQVNVNKVTLDTRYRKKIAAYETILADKSRPDKVWINEDARSEAIAAIEKDIADTKAEYKKHVEETARFLYTPAEDAFWAKFQKATCGMHIRLAFQEWASSYDLKVADTDLLNRVEFALSGKRSSTAREKVNTGKCNAARRKQDILRVMYGEVADYMVEKNLLPKMQFDPDIVAAYAPKSKKSAK